MDKFEQTKGNDGANALLEYSLSYKLTSFIEGISSYFRKDLGLEMTTTMDGTNGLMIQTNRSITFALDESLCLMKNLADALNLSIKISEVGIDVVNCNYSSHTFIIRFNEKPREIFYSAN